MTTVLISYDYRCPFAKIMHMHVLGAQRAGLDLNIVFSPWTMSQGHRDNPLLDVWDDPSKMNELCALAASASVRDTQPAHFATVHEALFRARHERFIRLATWVEVAQILEEVGVDVDLVAKDMATGRPLGVLRDTFRHFETLEAFGVPTFVINGDATFVRYMDAPTSDESSRDLIESLVALMTTRPALNEFKHTRLPN